MTYIKATYDKIDSNNKYMVVCYLENLLFFRITEALVSFNSKLIFMLIVLGNTDISEIFFSHIHLTSPEHSNILYM